jgi:predicted NAD/FAD-binding protein
MPFDPISSPRRRIAVIGGGISGMSAAHMLSRDNTVVLFEAAPRLGGHARTVLAGKRGDQPVDTGFIVFNRVNYPNLVRLFEELSVPVAPSDMSFAASIDGGRFEYGLRNLGSLFAQKRNTLRPAYLRMLRDVWRFNAGAERLAEQNPDLTIAEFLERLGTGDWFRDYYITPLSGAIWSTPTRGILDFPAQAMVRFFKNHALLSHRGQHQWYTVQGGSIQYVSRLEAAMARAGVEIRLGAAVAAVRREGGGVLLRAHGGEWETFDEVVFATHSDDSLAMLADPDPSERAALGAVRYQPNEAVLHADANTMPRRRAIWSSWNYVEERGRPADRIDLTYWMNCLQPIPKDDPLFVTLNSTRPIREDLIYDSTTFRHPVYDKAALAAQGQIRAFNGNRGTWFCGAWMKNGFHEDGIASAVDVVERFRARAESVAAE